MQIEVPYLGSLILTHSLDGAVQGLNDFPADQRPPVWPVFFAFRLMVAIGFSMLGRRRPRTGGCSGADGCSPRPGSCASASGRRRWASSRSSPAGR